MKTINDFNFEYKDGYYLIQEKRITEGNYWNDKFWGVCLKSNQGQNHLGKLLMNIREEIENG